MTKQMFPSSKNPHSYTTPTLCVIFTTSPKITILHPTNLSQNPLKPPKCTSKPLNLIRLNPLYKAHSLTHKTISIERGSHSTFRTNHLYRHHSFVSWEGHTFRPYESKYLKYSLYTLFCDTKNPLSTVWH